MQTSRLAGSAAVAGCEIDLRCKIHGRHLGDNRRVRADLCTFTAPGASGSIHLDRSRIDRTIGTRLDALTTPRAPVPVDVHLTVLLVYGPLGTGRDAWLRAVPRPTIAVDAVMVLLPSDSFALGPTDLDTIPAANTVGLVQSELLDGNRNGVLLTDGLAVTTIHAELRIDGEGCRLRQDNRFGAAGSEAGTATRAGIGTDLDPIDG